jgi:hypothetical protein
MATSISFAFLLLLLFDSAASLSVLLPNLAPVHQILETVQCVAACHLLLSEIAGTTTIPSPDRSQVDEPQILGAGVAYSRDNQYDTDLACFRVSHAYGTLRN